MLLHRVGSSGRLLFAFAPLSRFIPVSALGQSSSISKYHSEIFVMLLQIMRRSLVFYMALINPISQTSICTPNAKNDAIHIVTTKIRIHRLAQLHSRLTAAAGVRARWSFAAVRDLNWPKQCRHRQLHQRYPRENSTHWNAKKSTRAKVRASLSSGWMMRRRRSRWHWATTGMERFQTASTHSCPKCHS